MTEINEHLLVVKHNDEYVISIPTAHKYSVDGIPVINSGLVVTKNLPLIEGLEKIDKSSDVMVPLYDDLPEISYSEWETKYNSLIANAISTNPIKFSTFEQQKEYSRLNDGYVRPRIKKYIKTHKIDYIVFNPKESETKYIKPLFLLDGEISNICEFDFSSWIKDILKIKMEEIGLKEKPSDMTFRDIPMSYWISSTTDGLSVFLRDKNNKSYTLLSKYRMSKIIRKTHKECLEIQDNFIEMIDKEIKAYDTLLNSKLDMFEVFRRLSEIYDMVTRIDSKVATQHNYTEATKAIRELKKELKEGSI
ncbi:MAG: hypothetical protein WC284_08790 [Candidimonas sp.]